MLSFERVIYEDIKEDCCSQELDLLIDANKSLIGKYSKENGVDVEYIKKQIKLHAPQFEKNLYTTKGFLKKNIFPILDILLDDYRNSFNEYLKLCGESEIEKNTRLVWDRKHNPFKLYIVGKKSRIEAEIKLVDESIGTFIEDKLHYLKAARNTSILRIGLFIKNYSWPICYMSYSLIDRDDKWEALTKSLNSNIDKDKIVELSRVFGCGNLPQNTISLLISYASKLFRKNKNFDYMITAVNITMGFSGNSMLASQFVPYATRPVNYLYDSKNRYCTKRKGIFSHSSVNNMPPNILYVRKIMTSTKRSLRYCKLVDICNNYSYNETAVEHEIYALRQDLECVWNSKTRYHGTVVNGGGYISKGQCGVSSLLLSKILEKRGYETHFCEGDALFPKSKNSIYNHCWIKIINYNKRNEDVVIDVTADQNGYGQKIIFKTEKDLKKLKIKYITKSEKKPLDVDVEHLIERLAYLEQELDEGGTYHE